MWGDAMKKDVFKVDQEGAIIEYLLMSEEEIQEARKNDRFIIGEGWTDKRFFEPKWDFAKEEWVEGLTDEEVQRREQEIIQQQSQLNEADMQALAILELATEIEKLKGGS